MAHEFKITDGDYYVSKSGSNANPGTIDLPFLTIEYAATQATTNDKIVVGTGNYEEVASASWSLKIFEADGEVIIPGDKSTAFIDRRLGIVVDRTSFRGIKFYNFEYLFYSNAGNNLFEFVDCLIVNSPMYGRRGVNLFYAGFLRTKIVNSPLDIVVRNGNITGGATFLSLERNIADSVFINSEIITCNISIFDCNIDSNSPVNFDTSDASPPSTVDINYYVEDGAGSFCNVRGEVGVDSVYYSDFEAYNTANPDESWDFCINQDPLFIGTPSRLEFLVQENSPLIGAGFGGRNIGDVRIGDLQNRNSLEWGLNPDTSGNTAFDANSALLLTSGTSSQRKARPKYLGQKRRSPRLVLNGLTDFLNSVPDDNNALVNPNHLVIAVAFGDTEAAVQAKIDADDYELFRYGERMRVDGGGLYTGESGYDWTDENDLLFSWYAIAPTIRDDYNEA